MLKSQVDESESVLCSLCFLYDSGWGARYAPEIEALITEAENHKDKPFFRAKNDHLMLPEDADSIVASIALVSKVREIAGLFKK